VTTVPTASRLSSRKKQMVASKLGRGDPIEARAGVLAKRVNDLNAAPAASF